MKLARAVLILGGCAAVVLASCASAPPAAPAQKPAAPAAAPAEKPAAPAAAPAVSKDYLGENIKLVGIGHDYGGPYSVRFYTAEVLTPPSPATKDEGLVKPTGKVRDSSDTEFWTPYIASSRPASKEDLKPGMLVFATWAGGRTERRSRDELARTTGEWSVYRVKDVSTLYKGTVTLAFHDTYGSRGWREYEFHVDRIRVVVGEIALDLMELPK